MHGHIAAIHIFKVDIELCYKRVEKTISDVVPIAEQKRAEWFFDSKDRNRYLVTRFVLRSVLSDFIDVPPEMISFHSYGNSKPAVRGIEFNLSHSGNLLMVAVSSRPVGIDLELIRADFDFTDLLPGSFSETEQFQIWQSDNSLRRFYWFWTRKEAVLKATGEGLVDDMDQLDVAGDVISRKESNYLVRTFPVIDDLYIFSLACEPSNCDVLFWVY